MAILSPRISASSIECVVIIVTRFFFFSRIKFQMFLRIFGSIPVVGSSYRGRGGGEREGGERGRGREGEREGGGRKRIKGGYRWISTIGNAFHTSISACKSKMSLM